MNRVIATISIWALLAAGAGAGEKDKVKLPEALLLALKQLAASDSYRFETSLESKKEQGVQGTYRKGQPVSFKADGTEFFKMGDTLVYKQEQKWQKTKRGVESDPLRILVPTAKILQTTLPHEELAGLPKFVKEIKQRKDGDAIVFTADLTREGCRKFLPPSQRSLAQRGKIVLHTGGDGGLVKYQTTIDIEGRLGNAEVQGTVTKEAFLFDIGKAKLEIPEGARKALE